MKIEDKKMYYVVNLGGLILYVTKHNQVVAYWTPQTNLIIRDLNDKEMMKEIKKTNKLFSVLKDSLYELQSEAILAKYGIK